MKQKSVLTTLFALTSSLSFSQDVNFWLAYGNAGFAALNSAAVGSELKPCNLPEFRRLSVQLKVTNLTSEGKIYGAGGTFLAFDRAVKNAGNYSNYSAFLAASTEKMMELANMKWAKGLPGRTNSGEETTVDLLPSGSMAFSGSAGEGTSLRPIGIWQAFGFGADLNLYLAPGASATLGEFEFIYHGLNVFSPFGFCWGDTPSETGINLFGTADASSRFNYLGSPSGMGGLRQEKKYGMITNIPEPTSLAPVGVALVCLVRRRRNSPMTPRR